ncbi:COR domain-containing protein [Desulfonema magnum]|uniref:non-specific serine/threonine protein kinase n=1 Tax=Desulfonema magnum TaxID=45655 RepID=A0A975BHG7_9BACT|nr:COR domain-containing protein [Desulfonema magnum]QTA85597.1 Leucine-rich repeat containing-protein [Desulfonema magnum]
MFHEDVLKIIRNAERKQAVELDLSDQEITHLPPEIGRLSSLQVLVVRGLKELPGEIGQLRNLSRLYLSYNQLKELPEEIAQLRNLSRLYLNSNQLCKLPGGIGQLRNLTRLYLSYNQLKELPGEIGQIRNLSRLYLSYNHLKELPEGIARLENLNILDLSSNQLKEFPKGITQLTNLTRLYLGSNQMTELPGEIGRLRNLTELNVSFNHLRTLPKEIARLRNLTLLYLDSNYLDKLPDEIAQVENLTELNLSANQLKMIPGTISHLRNLTLLCLDVNELKDIPKEIAQLEKLTHLSLDKNPLRFPPPEIASQGLSAIRDYLQESGKGGQPLYEGKVMVVGQGGVGKTCLTKRLTKNEYSEDQKSTRGINIQPWKITGPDKTKIRMTLNVWDFGGQEIYHATHQFFLTRRSLYLLVWDACQEEENSRIDYWLNAIETFAEDSPILIVMNKADERSNDLNFHELKQRYPQIAASVKVSAKNGTGIKALRTLICKQAWKLPLMGTFWPSFWLTVRKALKATSRYYISHKKYLEVCEKAGIEDSEARTLSRYLHDLGIILHFQNDILLRNTIILNPEWGTDAVYKVLDAKIVQERNGILYNRDLPGIWRDQTLYPRNKYTTILRLMANFELIFPLNERGRHIVVEFLSPKEVTYDWNPYNFLQFEYHYEFLPAGVVTRLIVRMNEFLAERDGEKLCWREGAYFKYKDARARISIRPYTKIIVIQIEGPAKKDFLAVIRSHFAIIHKTIRKIRFREKIPCICSPGCEHRFDYHFLLKCEEKNIENVICEKHAEYINVGSLLDRIEKAEIRWERIRKRAEDEYQRFDMRDADLPIPSQKIGVRPRIRTSLLILATLVISLAAIFIWTDGMSWNIEGFFKEQVHKVKSIWALLMRVLGVLGVRC